jgi:hypothetical protein
MISQFSADEVRIAIAAGNGFIWNRAGGGEAGKVGVAEKSVANGYSLG